MNKTLGTSYPPELSDGNFFSISEKYGISLDEYTRDPNSRNRLLEIVCLRKLGQYVYFLIPPADHISSFNLPEDFPRDCIYKVGHTEGFLYDRIKKYGKGTKLLNFQEVEHSYGTEQLILDELKKQGERFRLVPGKREYYQGDINGINDIFCHVSENCVTLNGENLERFHQEFEDQMRNSGVGLDYYPKLPFQLTNIGPESEELYWFKLKNHFIMNFMSMNFRQKYEFTQSLRGKVLNLWKARDMMLIPK